MTGPGGHDGYVPGDGLTRAERRRQSEQDSKRRHPNEHGTEHREHEHDTERREHDTERREHEHDTERRRREHAAENRPNGHATRHRQSEQVARRRRTEHDARRYRGDRAASAHDRAGDMARAATVMARSRRGPRRVEPVARQRVRRAPKPQDKSRPLYARLLRLSHLRPGGLACFLLFEGVIALAVLLSLAELVNWFSVIVLPVVVAGIVKIHDVIAGAFARADAARRKRGPARPPRARGVAKVRGIAAVLPIMPRPRDTSDQVEPADPDAVDDPQVTRKMARLANPANGRRRQSNQRRFPMETRRAGPPSSW